MEEDGRWVTINGYRVFIKNKSVNKYMNEMIRNSVKVIQNNENLMYDNQNNELTNEQKEFFKDSVARDENGNLLVMYHGAKSNFEVFDSKSQIYWFTNNKEYSDNYWTLEGGTKKCYLNVTNPFDLGDININIVSGINELADSLAGSNDLREVSHVRRKLIEFAQKSNYRSEKSLSDEPLYVLTNTKAFRDFIKDKGYDGLKATEYGYTTYGVFESNQIKNINNKKPTKNNNINK